MTRSRTGSTSIEGYCLASRFATRRYSARISTVASRSSRPSDMPLDPGRLQHELDATMVEFVSNEKSVRGTACYLTTVANRTPKLPFSRVREQLNALRPALGPMGKVQTSGEVTLLEPGEPAAAFPDQPILVAWVSSAPPEPRLRGRATPTPERCRPRVD